MRPAPVAPLLASATMSDGVDEPLAEERDERQKHRRGVAARVRDEPGAAQAIPVGLAQAEDRLADEVRGLVVVAVPLLVALGGGQAQVAREVDHDRLRPRLAQARGVGRGDAVGQREEVGVGLLLEPGLVGEVARLAAGRERDAGARVAPQQAHQLPPRVTRRPEHPHACAHSPSPSKRKPAGIDPAGSMSPLDLGPRPGLEGPARRADGPRLTRAPGRTAASIDMTT